LNSWFCLEKFIQHSLMVLITRLIASSVYKWKADHTYATLIKTGALGEASKAQTLNYKWKIMVSLCIERFPVIVRGLNSIEKQYKDLMDRIEFENSLYSQHELRLLEDEKRLALKKTGEIHDYDSVMTAADFEDACTQKLEEFNQKYNKKADDHMTNTDSLWRNLDRKLLLVVNHAEKKHWLLPEIQIENGETLHDASVRLLTSIVEPTNAMPYAYAPVGFFKFKYPKPVATKYHSIGEKIFFFKCHLKTKYPEEIVPKIENYKWLNHDELISIFPPKYYKSISVMGIKTLLPVVKAACRDVNIEEFRGKTVAVDASCWLHRALFGCAYQLATGIETDSYVKFCCKWIKVLLSHHIRVIMVFDGRNVPAKKDTNSARKERRQSLKEKGQALSKSGKHREALQCFQQATEITFDMIVNLIKAIKSIPNVDYLVAPYEADAQLAYLAQNGIAHLVISEDSDLIPFGCSKVLFKMDMLGDGVLYEKENLHLAMNVPEESFSFQNFRRSCILSGCDYLENLPGIGIKKSIKFFQKTFDDDIRKALPKIPSYLNMPNLEVNESYIERFIEAENAFLYQLVFDPRKKQLVSLNAYPDGMNASDFPYAGLVFEKHVAIQIARGMINPHTLQHVTEISGLIPNKKSPKNNKSTPVEYAFSFSGSEASVSMKDIKVAEQLQETTEINDVYETYAVSPENGCPCEKQSSNNEESILEKCNSRRVDEKPVLRSSYFLNAEHKTEMPSPRKVFNPCKAYQTRSVSKIMENIDLAKGRTLKSFNPFKVADVCDLPQEDSSSEEVACTEQQDAQATLGKRKLETKTELLKKTTAKKIRGKNSKKNNPTSPCPAKKTLFQYFSNQPAQSALSYDRNLHTTLPKLKRIYKKRDPIQFNKKSEKPQAKVWQSMSINDLAIVLKCDVDDIFECIMTTKYADLFENVSDKIEDLNLIVHIVRQFGYSINTDEELDASPLPLPPLEQCKPRPPVVTIMGHVDHGKTTLLDSLRHSHIVDEEFGAITQHIGAFSVKLPNDRVITFLDTPGHAVFKKMRFRGAQVTDMVILVVAADDGVMEQTVESIRMAQESHVPIVVAINKCDKFGVDLDSVKRQLLEYDVVGEQYGGDVQIIPISALKGTNLDLLCEAVLTQADLMELVADYEGPVEGVVLESKTAHGQGKVCFALVKRGCLRKGVVLVAGSCWCKVRSLFDENKVELKMAKPSFPVEITGWKGDEIPSAGEAILQVENERRAKQVTNLRKRKQMIKKALDEKHIIDQRRAEERLEYLKIRERKLQSGYIKYDPLADYRRKKEAVSSYDGPILPFLLKADVDGSLEAILDVYETYNSTKCNFDLVHFGIGDVTENDLEIADTFKAIIFCFNVSIGQKEKALADSKGIQLRKHNVIYSLIDDFKKELNSRLPPVNKEVIIGEGSVIKEFMVSDMGRKKVPIAGCSVKKGILTKNDRIRFLRNGEVIYDGSVISMRREKDLVSSSQVGQEVGIKIENSDVRFNVDDQVICYKLVEEQQWKDRGIMQMKMKVMKNEEGRCLSMAVVRRPVCETMRWPVTRRINFLTNLKSWHCWTASTWRGALNGHAAAIIVSSISSINRGDNNSISSNCLLLVHCLSSGYWFISFATGCSYCWSRWAGRSAALMKLAAQLAKRNALLVMDRLAYRRQSLLRSRNPWGKWPSEPELRLGFCSSLRIAEENIRMLLLAVLLVIYLVIGAMLFSVIERKQEALERLVYSEKLEHFKMQHCTTGGLTLVNCSALDELLEMRGKMSAAGMSEHRSSWDFFGSFYFVSTVVTTIGFGMTTPRTAIGKAVVILYGFVGCSSSILFFNLFLERILTFLSCLFRVGHRIRLPQSNSSNCGRRGSDEQSGSLETEWRPNLYFFWIGLLILSSTTITLAALLYQYAEDWSYLEAVYFCFVSFATIGFGDFISSQRTSEISSYKLYSILNFAILFVGCCCIYSLFNVTSIVIRSLLDQIIASLDCRCRLFGRFRHHKASVARRPVDGLHTTLDQNAKGAYLASVQTGDGLLSLKEFLDQTQDNLLSVPDQLLLPTEHDLRKSSVSASSVGPMAIVNEVIAWLEEMVGDHVQPVRCVCTCDHVVPRAASAEVMLKSIPVANANSILHRLEVRAALYYLPGLCGTLINSELVCFDESYIRYERKFVKICKKLFTEAINLIIIIIIIIMASHKSSLNRQQALKTCHSFGRICPINSSSKAAKTGRGCSSSTFTATCSMDEGCAVGDCNSDLQAPMPAAVGTTTVDLNDVDGAVGSAEAMDEGEAELLLKTNDNKLPALFKGNFSVDGHLRNRLQHAPQALCHSADCIDGQYPDASNALCPLCGRAATLVRRPMSPSSDARNAIYEVSNDFIKLFGSKRQYGLLLSGPVDLATPDQQSHYPSRLSSDKSDQHLLQSGAAAAVQTAPLMPRPPGNYLLPKRKSAYGVLWKDKQNWRQKLRTRKRLFYQRNKVCDLCLLFALAGILITVLEAELTSHQFFLKTAIVSQVLRSIIVVTTVVLLFLILMYHATEVKILVNDSDAQDWRVAVTWQRVAQATLELVVCAVCPIPGSVSIPWSVLDKTHRKLLVTQVPLDTVLSMPMFFRFYLICRFMALRSRQFRDAATRSIAALNHISVNFTFVLKTLMHENPLRVLIIFTVFFWIIMAWILRQCEQFDTIEDQIKYMNSLWFIIITFMSIGYGDVTPHTYCGRTVAISTGIVGAGVSSALIAVISRKLELSRSEKHVNNFMADSKLARERKHAAAAVLQHTWFIHKFRCLHFPRDEMKLRHHQKKFLAAITEFQRIKWEQRKVADESNALIDVAKLQSDMHEILFEMQRVQEFLVSKVDVLMKQLDKLERTLTTSTGSSNNNNNTVLFKRVQQHYWNFPRRKKRRKRHWQSDYNVKNLHIIIEVNSSKVLSGRYLIAASILIEHRYVIILYFHLKCCREERKNFFFFFFSLEYISKFLEKLMKINY
ncbi:Translation initiation factor IF-2, mitochondrial, partial [Trichinella papuae]